MEHYFLYVYNGLLSNEKQFLINYIKRLVPGHEDADTELVSTEMLCSSTYFNEVCLNSKLEKIVRWKELNPVIDTNQVICCQNTDEISEIKCESSLIADYINTLADQLPICGSFQLDVIISGQLIENFSVSENIELAASLHRLTKWHNAHTVFLADNIDHLNFQEWLGLTNAEILNSKAQLNLGSLLWRGSIEFKHPNISTQYYEGFELKFKSENKQFYRYLTTLESSNSTSKHLILYPILRTMDVCSFTSLPQHMILPTVFSLCSPSNNQSNYSIMLCDYLTKQNGAALILRMGYSMLREKPKPDKSLCTSKWQKMVFSGNVKYPDSSLPEVDNYFTLAITKAPNSEIMLAYALREPSSLGAEFYFNAVNTLNPQSGQSSERKAGNEDIELDYDVPFLSESAFQSILCKVWNSNINSEDSGCGSEPSSSDMNTLLSSFVSSINSSEHRILHLNESSVSVKYNDIDPTDWPERVYLLHKQMRDEEEKKNIRSIFLNLSPQRSQYNVSFSGDDIKKYFLPSGEAKDDNKAEPVQSLSDKVNHNQENFKQLLQKQWPEVLNCTYADIYYNINKQSEEKENVGNEMVRCFVQHETASTCNKQQSIPDAPISMQAKYLTPRKRPKSCKSETSLRQDMMKPNAKVKENIFKTKGMLSNPVISTIMKTLGVSKSPKSASIPKMSQKRLPRKSSLPVRCSPRKTTSVNYFPSSSRKSSDHQNKKSPNELPELLKKKLRVAVASALESNDINMNDSLFRPCFKKLFTICHAFVQDIPRKGSVSQHMQKIADAHVKQVIKFEKQKDKEK